MKYQKQIMIFYNTNFYQEKLLSEKRENSREERYEQGKRSKIRQD